MKLFKSILVIALCLLTLWINSPITHVHQSSHKLQPSGFNNAHSIEHCYLCDQMLQSTAEATQRLGFVINTYSKFFFSNAIAATDLLVFKALKDRAPPMI